MERTKPVSLRVSDAAVLEIAEQSEGFVGYTYDDADPKPLAKKTFITEANAQLVDGRLTGPFGGTLTKGYGHTATAKPGDRLTREEALELLRRDMRDAESCVHRYVNVPLTQGEFDGVTDLFFNVGPGTLPCKQYPQGKDGIACLGKSGGGRPSTLLTKLNEGDYEAAANCFSQWRMPRSVFEWGLLKRRIRFMLIFMGLPIVRAMMSLPNVMPTTDQGRFALIQKCIALARDELQDKQAMKPPLEAVIDGVKTRGEAVGPKPDPIPVAVGANDTLTLGPDQIIPSAPPAAAAGDAGATPAPPQPAAPESVPAAQPDPPSVGGKPEYSEAEAPSPSEAPASPLPDPPAGASVSVNTPTASVEVEASSTGSASVTVEEPEAKHPVNSWSIWGGMILYFLPDLGPFAEKILTVEIAGPIGHVLRGLALAVLIFGRMAASMPISIKAKAKMPKLRKL